MTSFNAHSQTFLERNGIALRTIVGNTLLVKAVEKVDVKAIQLLCSSSTPDLNSLKSTYPASLIEEDKRIREILKTRADGKFNIKTSWYITERDILNTKNNYIMSEYIKIKNAEEISAPVMAIEKSHVNILEYLLKRIQATSTEDDFKKYISEPVFDLYNLIQLVVMSYNKDSKDAAENVIMMEVLMKYGANIKSNVLENSQGLKFDLIGLALASNNIPALKYLKEKHLSLIDGPSIFGVQIMNNIIGSKADVANSLNSAKFISNMMTVDEEAITIIDEWIGIIQGKCVEGEDAITRYTSTRYIYDGDEHLGTFSLKYAVVKSTKRVCDVQVEPAKPSSSIKELKTLAKMFSFYNPQTSTMYNPNSPSEFYIKIVWHAFKSSHSYTTTSLRETRGQGSYGTEQKTMTEYELDNNYGWIKIDGKNNSIQIIEPDNGDLR